MSNQKKCRKCGKLCWGTYCKDCTKIGKWSNLSRRGIAKRRRDKKNAE